MSQMNTTQGPSTQTPTPASPAVNDQIQQTILRQQNIRRQIEAREEQNRRRQLEAQEDSVPIHEKIHQIDLKIEEGDARRRQLRAYGGGDPDAGHTVSMGATITGGHSLEDYQLQLMVLELQNIKRLMIARYEQETQTTWLRPEVVYHGDRPDVE